MESFQLQRVLNIKTSNYKWSKRDVRNYGTYTLLQSSNILNYRALWSLIELASLYTVPLSAVNGLSRLTKLTTSKGAGTSENFRISQLLSNRIESDGRFEYESNLEASRVPSTHLYCRVATLLENLENPEKSGNFRLVRESKGIRSQGNCGLPVLSYRNCDGHKINITWVLLSKSWHAQDGLPIVPHYLLRSTRRPVSAISHGDINIVKPPEVYRQSVCIPLAV